MSYNLTIQCGCFVYVSCDPKTRIPHTRIIERRGAACRERTHAVGVRLSVWQLAPQRPAAGRQAGDDGLVLMH